jgi:hypothetical protein
MNEVSSYAIVNGDTDELSGDMVKTGAAIIREATV